ncbi:hypothetical protein [Rossellomorea marisflavi]|nr:hypothetical protein [Rossellomorea marisflavi]
MPKHRWKSSSTYTKNPPTGHGEYMEGDDLKKSLDYLVAHFNEIALP